jgi:hypothetical protein
MSRPRRTDDAAATTHANAPDLLICLTSAQYLDRLPHSRKRRADIELSTPCIQECPPASGRTDVLRSQQGMGLAQEAFYPAFIIQFD